jgi:hypothetical protein
MTDDVILYMSSARIFAYPPFCRRYAVIHSVSDCGVIRVIKSRRMRWAGHVARMGEARVAYRILVGRPDGRRPLGRPRRRWEDNIKMDLQEVGCGAWTGLIWLRIGTGGGLL